MILRIQDVPSAPARFYASFEYYIINSPLKKVVFKKMRAGTKSPYQLSQNFGNYSKLDNTLRNHRIRNLLKAGDVSAHHKVALVAIVLGSIIGIVENIDHDSL